MTFPADSMTLARDLLLRPAGLDEGSIDRALATVLDSAVDDADIYFQLSRDESWALEDGMVKEGSASIEQGVGVRALVGEKTGFAYSGEIVMPALEEAARAARAIAAAAGCQTSDVIAYIGPHIRACHYAVGDEIMSQFCNTFDTVARADSGGLDLDATVTASLVDAGVAPCSIARLGICTAEATDRFFSYRSEDGRTGRHSAFACVVSGGSSA